MRPTPNKLDPERLMQATEAAMQAAEDVAEYTQGPLPYPADLMGSPLQPDVLASFTKYEIEVASEFLARMGYISARPERPAA